MKTILDLELKNKVALVRVDFNVPIEDGVITDNLRIVSAIPTIEHLIKKGAKVILCSHLGRPKGVAQKEFSLEVVGVELSKLMKMNVVFSDDDEVVSQKTLELVEHFKGTDDKILLLQNTRFVSGEKKNDLDFARKLATLADIFVLDAFGTAHRAHSSTVGVAEFIPAYGGFLMEKEIKYLLDFLEEPERPFTIVMGGAKVSDKITLIENLLKKADNIVIGGAMANTFLKAQGYDTGASKVEEDNLDIALDTLKLAKERGVNIYLPTDIVGATEFSNDTAVDTYEISSIPKNVMALDIGAKTIEEYCSVIKNSKTVVFNGPMGVFELSNYEKGTKALVEAMATFGGVSIACGGDSAASVKQFGFSDKFTHVSTGGGASLELLEGKELPGIKIVK